MTTVRMYIVLMPILCSYVCIILYICVCNNIKCTYIFSGCNRSGYLFLYHFQEGNTDIAPVRPVVPVVGD